MIKVILIILLLITCNQLDKSKTLIIYFSRAGENMNVGKIDKGNTEIMVDYIKEKTNISVYKLIPETLYPENYTQCLEVVQTERTLNITPKIKNPITNIDNYDTILLGYPIWLNNLPYIIETLLESLDLKGKTIYPFNTHEGSGKGNSIDDIIKCAPNSNIKDGFSLRGSYARTVQSREDINKWLNETLKINISENINVYNNNLNDRENDSDDIDDVDEDFNVIKPEEKKKVNKAGKIVLYIFLGLVGLIVLLVIAVGLGKACR